MKHILQDALIKKRLFLVERQLQKIISFDDTFISREVRQILESGGKRLRPLLLLLVAEYFENKTDDIYKVAAIMELIHVSSLIHDDINDGAKLRRGQQTINDKYNDELAVHLGDYLLMKTLSMAYEVKNSEMVLSTIAQMAIEMSKGEFVQIQSLFDLNQSLKDYYYKIERKTAFLIANCCKLGACLSEASAEEIEAFYQYGFHLGIAFQIKDDLLDIAQTSHIELLGKPIGCDLLQGHINLPTLLVLNEEFSEKEELLNIINSRFPKGKEDSERALEIIRHQDAIEKSEGYILKHIEQAKAALNILKPKKIVDYFYESADYIWKRNK